MSEHDPRTAKEWLDEPTGGGETYWEHIQSGAWTREEAERFVSGVQAYGGVVARDLFGADVLGALSVRAESERDRFKIERNAARQERDEIRADMKRVMQGLVDTVANSRWP